MLFLSEAFLFADDISIFGLQCSDLELAKDVARPLKWFQRIRLTADGDKKLHMKITSKNASKT